ncbi:hypothetical protein BC826DRAFT_1045476 [Russula brevipes]|nr:hypothetical protein BC826DRAFT_1045476 [Russula brevipes]
MFLDPASFRTPGSTFYRWDGWDAWIDYRRKGTICRVCITAWSGWGRRWLGGQRAGQAVHG